MELSSLTTKAGDISVAALRHLHAASIESIALRAFAVYLDQAMLLGKSFGPSGRSSPAVVVDCANLVLLPGRATSFSPMPDVDNGAGERVNHRTTTRAARRIRTRGDA